MYKTLTAQAYKSILGLPDGYHIDGMLCYGGWDRDKYVGIFKEALENCGKKFEYGKLPNFLERIVEFNIEGKRYWFEVSYGGALLSEQLHLACLFGSKKNILIGSCGGLYPDIEGGDFIFPTYSWGDESATRMYDPDAQDHKHYAEEKLTTSIKQKINSKYKVWDGSTMTCQAMMAETLEDVQKWSKEGYYGVEMEAATVFAVSNHFNVPASAILVVADNLIKGETVASESYHDRKLIREEARTEQYRVALEELLN